MFFRRKNIEFSNQQPFNQLENVLKKYIEPRLLEFGFKMYKDVQYHTFSFKRKYKQFEHEIIFNLSHDSLTPGGALFFSEWSIYYNDYFDWHFKNYGEYCLTPEFASWDDNSCEKIDDKYCKPDFHGHSKEYDLGNYSTKKLMAHYLKQTLDIRLPMLEYYSEWSKLGDWNSIQLAHLGIAKIFDCYILANDINRAGSVLKQAEDYLKINTDELEYRSKIIEKRKEYLKKLIQN